MPTPGASILRRIEWSGTTNRLGTASARREAAMSVEAAPLGAASNLLSTVGVIMRAQGVPPPNVGIASTALVHARDR
jgi:hypothetical protein